MRVIMDAKINFDKVEGFDGEVDLVPVTFFVGNKSNRVLELVSQSLCGYCPSGVRLDNLNDIADVPKAYFPSSRNGLLIAAQTLSEREIKDVFPTLQYVYVKQLWEWYRLPLNEKSKVLSGFEPITGGSISVVKHIGLTGIVFESGAGQKRLDETTPDVMSMACFVLALLAGNNKVWIIEEPEVHLRPEQQIEFAKVLVSLQKELGLTLVMNTHSVYFLRAMEVFVDKENIECRYYNVQDTVNDVTENTDGVYQDFARPFQVLDAIYYADQEV